MMKVSELERIGSEIYGETRWGKKMAQAINVSPALISSMRRGRVPISDKTEARVRTFYENVTNRGKDKAAQAHPPPSVSVSEDTASFSDTSLRGEAAFRMKLVAQDILSGKWVKVRDVNPALFFPQFDSVNRGVVAGAPVPGNDTESPQFVVDEDDSALSDEEILERIGQRIRVMDRITEGVIQAQVPSMIAYGASGVGKSFSILEAMKEAKARKPRFHYDLIKGSVRAPGLFKALFKARKGGVVILDDSDSIFEDEEALNLLKAALDSSEERIISWRKESPWLKEMTDKDGKIVRDFVYEGGVIFITNINMRKRIMRGHRMAPHYEALISRSHYIDLTMDSIRARMLRVRQVFLNAGMYKTLNLTRDEAEEIVQFMDTNRNRILEVSLRMIKMITQVYRTDPKDWKEIIEVTKMTRPKY